MSRFSSTFSPPKAIFKRRRRRASGRGAHIIIRTNLLNCSSGHGALGVRRFANIFAVKSIFKHLSKNSFRERNPLHGIFLLITYAASSIIPNFLSVVSDWCLALFMPQAVSAHAAYSCAWLNRGMYKCAGGLVVSRARHSLRWAARAERNYMYFHQ